MLDQNSHHRWSLMPCYSIFVSRNWIIPARMSANINWPLRAGHSSLMQLCYVRRHWTPEKYAPAHRETSCFVCSPQPPNITCCESIPGLYVRVFVCCCCILLRYVYTYSIYDCGAGLLRTFASVAVFPCNKRNSSFTLFLLSKAAFALRLQHNIIVRFACAYTIHNTNDCSEYYVAVRCIC